MIGKVTVLIVIGHIASRLPYNTQDNYYPDKKIGTYPDKHDYWIG